MVTIETDYIKDSGNKMKVLNKQFKEELDTLKKRVSSILTTTQEWKGNAAKAYVENTLSDIEKYKMVAQLIDLYANELTTISDNYATAVNGARY